MTAKSLFKTVDDFTGPRHIMACAGNMFDEVGIVFEAIADHIGVDKSDEEFVILFFQGSFLDMKLGDMEQAGIPNKKGNEQKDGKGGQRQSIYTAAIGPGGIVKLIENPLADFGDQFIAVFLKTRHPLLSPGNISFKEAIVENATTF